MHSRFKQAKVYTAGTSIQCQANELIEQEVKYRFRADGETERQYMQAHPACSAETANGRSWLTSSVMCVCIVACHVPIVGNSDVGHHLQGIIFRSRFTFVVGSASQLAQTSAKVCLRCRRICQSQHGNAYMAAPAAAPFKAAGFIR